MALVTLTELKNALNISGTTNDVILATFSDYVTDMCTQYLGRTIESTSYTEYYDHDGISNELFLKQYPIISISEINVDLNYSWPSSSALTATTNYITENEIGRVISRGGHWIRGKQHIKVTYTAGYAVVPNSIKNAAIYWVGRIYSDHFQSRRDRISVTLPGGQTISMADSNAMPPMVKLILDRYKRPMH